MNTNMLFALSLYLENAPEAGLKTKVNLAKKLVAVGREGDGFETVLGKTISTNDFYEGQVGFCTMHFAF